MASEHNSFREGARLGVIVATAIWVWLAMVDLIAGEPFRTFTVLGGIVLFTVLHYLINIAYGVAVVSGIHGAAREPSLLIAVAFGFVIIQFALAMVTVLLVRIGLGQLAWVRILGGNVIGAAIGFVILSRKHALREVMREAEEEEAE